MNLNKRNRTHLAMVYSPGCVVNMVLFAFPVKLLQVIISECFVKKLYTWCKQPINLLFRAIHLLTKNKLIFSEQYILFVRNCENIISRQPNTIGIAYLSFSKKPPPLLCWFKFWVVNYRPVICMSWILSSESYLSSSCVLFLNRIRIFKYAKILSHFYLFAG